MADRKRTAWDKRPLQSGDLGRLLVRPEQIAQTLNGPDRKAVCALGKAEDPERGERKWMAASCSEFSARSLGGERNSPGYGSLRWRSCWRRRCARPWRKHYVTGLVH